MTTLAWVLIAFSIVWLIVLSLFTVGLSYLISDQQIKQGELNDRLVRGHWSLDERITMINERVNNIKMLFKP